MTPRTRRVVQAAAYGGGTVGLVGALGAALYGLLLGETKLARRRIPKATTDAPKSDGTVWAAEGVSARRPPINIAMLGDSTAAGYGVHRDRDTPGARIAIGLSSVARRPVRLHRLAVVGAESSGLAEQVDRLPNSVDLVVIMIGANDVTHRIKTADSVRWLSEAVARIRAKHIQVVVGTCPDLGTIRPVPQPLRWIGARMARHLAAAQTVAVVGAGGRTVSMGDLLGPIFARRRDMFSDDQFHPSAAGYAAAADAVLPSCLDVLGLRTRHSSASTFTTRRPRPVARAAVRAAAHPGTEVAATDFHGEKMGRRGPLARLQRVRPATPVSPVHERARTVEVPA